MTDDTKTKNLEAVQILEAVQALGSLTLSLTSAAARGWHPATHLRGQAYAATYAIAHLDGDDESAPITRRMLEAIADAHASMHGAAATRDLLAAMVHELASDGDGDGDGDGDAKKCAGVPRDA